jgi:membrane associated rhomboid family serine protease
VSAATDAFLPVNPCGGGGTHLDDASRMSTTIVAITFLAGAVVYVLPAAVRHRLAHPVLRLLEAAARAALPVRPAEDACEHFLRARTRFAVVTPVLIAANVYLFVRIVLEPGWSSDTQTLINWGANYAPRTTTGEWGRSITSIFVHGGGLQLIATIVGLATAGVFLERAVGRLALAAAFLASGIMASVVTLSTSSPSTVSYGPSGALFGVYGLLIATAVCGYLRFPRMPISRQALERVAGGAVVCVGHALLTDHLGPAAEFAGMTTGMVAGLVVARGVAVTKPAIPRAAVVTFATLALAVVSHVSVEGVEDARPEIAATFAVEARTAAEYNSALRHYTHGKLSGQTLAQLIDRAILPSVVTQRARIESLQRVPREQAPLVVAARQYFTWREDSWRRRAAALRKGNTTQLRDAERSERAALDALHRTHR